MATAGEMAAATRTPAAVLMQTNPTRPPSTPPNVRRAADTGLLERPSFMVATPPGHSENRDAWRAPTAAGTLPGIFSIAGPGAPVKGVVRGPRAWQSRARRQPGRHAEGRRRGC